MTKLSHRQQQIVELACKGINVKTIAGDLGISEKTVHDHIKKLRTKENLQGRSLLEIVIWAFQNGLAKVPRK